MNSTPPTPTPAQDYSSDHAKWLALFGVWLVYASFGAMAASIAPLLPEIRRDLDIGSTAMGAIMGAWPLAYVFVAIPAGLLLDRIGTRAGLFVAALIIALSGVLRAHADGTAEMLIAVAVFGLGGPLVSTGAPKLIAQLFNGAQRATAMGMYMTGPALGGILALSLTHSVLLPMFGDWRGVMLIYAILALASAFVWLLLSKAASQKSADKRAAPFSLLAVSSLVREPVIALLLVLAVGIFYINHGLNNWLPSVLRAAGMSGQQAGQWAAIPTLVGLIAALTLPRLATPARRLPILMGLFAIALVTSLVLLLTTGPVLLAGLALQGVARGTMNTVAILILVERPEVPPERVGLAGGLFFSAAEIGGMLGPFSFGLLLDLTGSFTAPLIVMAILCALMCLLTLGLRRRSYG